MENFAFAPIIDRPLTIITLAGFLVNFHLSANSNNDPSGIDLEDRLSTARIRIVVFFALLLVICWVVNLAVWSIFALMLVLGLLVSMIAGQSLAPEITLFAAAAILREWSFGFPNLILSPPTENCSPVDDEPHELVGQYGIITAPLRPSGDIMIEGREFSAVSDSGRLIEVGTRVIVTGYRNGRVIVARENER